MSKVIVNWGAVPPMSFSLYGGDGVGSGFWKALSDCRRVKISAPYDPVDAKIVHLRMGNMTEVVFTLSQAEVRLLKLASWRGPMPLTSLGATAAEINVIGEEERGGGRGGRKDLPRRTNGKK